MALVITLSQMLTAVTSATTPEDWPPYSFSAHADELRNGADSYTTAFLNVTYEDVELGVLVSDKTEEGRYGGGYVGPAAGYVVHVRADADESDHSGCKLPLRSSRPDGLLPPPGEPWIALIRRGKCNFEVKVENAYRSNAAAVLVYNDRDSSQLEKMKISDDSNSKLHFTCTYTYEGEGEGNGKLLLISFIP